MRYSYDNPLYKNSFQNILSLVENNVNPKVVTATIFCVVFRVCRELLIPTVENRFSLSAKNLPPLLHSGSAVSRVIFLPAPHFLPFHISVNMSRYVGKYLADGRL